MSIIAEGRGLLPAGVISTAAARPSCIRPAARTSEFLSAEAPDLVNKFLHRAAPASPRKRTSSNIVPVEMRRARQSLLWVTPYSFADPRFLSPAGEFPNMLQWRS